MKEYAYAIPLAVTWMFLKGDLSLLALVEGGLFGVLAVLISRSIVKPEALESLPRVLRRAPAFFRYLAFFLPTVILGNLDVAYRALHPRLPVHPGILAVDIHGMSEVEVAMMANTITLTPGTLTMDVDMERGLLFVHTINAKELEEVRHDLVEIGRHVGRVFR